MKWIKNNRNMETQIDDKKYYEEIERQIIKEATTNGVSFEEAALINREIKMKV